MRRHHLKLLSLWLLPLLLARASIPSGFMLSAATGGLQLVFCPAGAVQPLASQQHAGHDGMHHGVADEASHSHNSDNAPCLFSLAAAAAPAEVPYLSGAAGGLSDEIFEFISAPIFRIGPARTDRIRGPPLHS